MSELAPTPQDPTAADAATACAIARGERLLARFEAITEFGMERLREGDSTPFESGMTPDPVKAYATASRVVRVSLIFEARIDGALRCLKAGPVSATPKDNPRVERWLRLLEEAGEIGMRLLTAHEGARRELDEEGKPRDTSEGFATLSRAVRLTLMLEARTDPELRVVKAGSVSAAPKPGAPKAGAPKAEVDPYAAERPLIISDPNRIEDVSTRVWEAIDHEAESKEEWDRLWDALWGRIGDDNEWLSADRPIRQSIEKLCKDIGLSPDWSRWDGEGWIDDGEPRRRRYSQRGAPGLSMELSPALLDQPASALPARAVESEFKTTLRQRVSEAIDTYAVNDEHFATLREALDRRLERDEPYMSGERTPLREAVFRLCEELRLIPDNCRWQDDGWIDDGARCRGPAPPPHNLE